LTNANAGNDALDSDADTSSGLTSVFTFDPSSGDDLTYDAGLYPVYTVGDIVWIDTDGDGTQNEVGSGLEGVTVILYDDNTGLPIDTVITDANGAYQFDEVPAGDYYIVFDPSTSNDVDGFVFSPTGAGTPATDNNADASGNSGTFSVSANVDNIDAGIIPQSDIGDYVWLDADKDGIQDASEGGVANITVNLHNAATNAIIATDVTDANGEYLFENQLAGNYYITFVNGTDYEFTSQGAGDGTNDSEADPALANGQTANFAFDPTTGDDLDHDAGLNAIGDIGKKPQQEVELILSLIYSQGIIT